MTHNQVVLAVRAMSPAQRERLLEQAQIRADMCKLIGKAYRKDLLQTTIQAIDGKACMQKTACLNGKVVVHHV